MIVCSLKLLEKAFVINIDVTLLVVDIVHVIGDFKFEIDLHTEFSVDWVGGVTSEGSSNNKKPVEGIAFANSNVNVKVASV